jgi:very-short-patch-repair endonuclease
MPKQFKPLSLKNPKLASEWHPSKNGSITPDDVAAGTNNFAWWICEQGHEWEARINSRNRGTGCPICYGRFQEPLTKTHPILALEWHPNKNGNLTPDDVTAGSTRKVYWKCSKCSYPWPSTITNRKHGNGCPKCAGKVVTEENALATINPDVLEEWHPTKNGKVTPDQIHAYSDKKVWWICKECIHEWRTTPNHRTSQKTACPKCKEKYNVSFEELAFVYFYNKVFQEVKFNHKIETGDKSYKVDIYVPKYKLILEYDSEFHHRDRLSIDSEKSSLLIKHCNVLIRMREQGLSEVPIQYVINITFSNKNRIQLKEAIMSSLQYITQIVNISEHEKHRIAVLKEVHIEEQRFKILSQVPPIEQKNNIKQNSSLLTKEFDLEKNFPFRPEHFSYGSSFKLWWTCLEGHSWESAPSTRKKGHGCPVCDGQIATMETSLGTVKNELSNEWDYEKNNGLTPFDILPNSNRKFWWKCSKEHSYEASPNHRSRGEGCPYCVGKRVNKENCLATVNPKLASQWHPTKNENLTPYDITAGSSKKVWWICDRGHEWQAPVYSRNGSKTNKPRGCKECYELGRRKKK